MAEKKQLDVLAGGPIETIIPFNTTAPITIPVEVPMQLEPCVLPFNDDDLSPRKHRNPLRDLHEPKEKKPNHKRAPEDLLDEAKELIKKAKEQKKTAR